MNHTETTDAFALSIAGLGVLVRCSPEEPVRELRENYRNFPLTGEVQLTLEIQIRGEERDSPLLDTGMMFRDGVLWFTAPGYEGYLSTEKGKGEIHLSSQYGAEDIDYALRVTYALLAFQAGGLMLHAAGIVREGATHLFFGHSGTGKTTISRLSSRGSVLNDDLVILLPTEKGWWAHGTPFWNPSQVKPGAQRAPAAGLYRLVQAKEASMEALEGGIAVAELAASVPVVSIDPARSAALLNRLSELSQAVPVRRLHFKPDRTFWRLIEGKAGEGE